MHDEATRRRWAPFARLVVAQHGVIARRQLLEIGFTRSGIEHRIHRGYLIRRHPGVYAVGRPDLPRAGWWMAAVLACGVDAILSHLSAAIHWELLVGEPSWIDVSVPRGRRRRGGAGLRVHRLRLGPEDRVVRDGIPVTAPMRTLLDLADVVPEVRVRAAFEQSERLGLFDRGRLEALLERSPGRRGLRVLTALLDEARDDPPELRSGDERGLLELIRAAGLPLPVTNAVVEGVTVDAYWPQHGLVVELDSYGYHRSRASFEQDHEETEHLQSAGFEVRRLTRDAVRRDPARAVETLAGALRVARRPGSAAPPPGKAAFAPAARIG